MAFLATLRYVQEDGRYEHVHIEISDSILSKAKEGIDDAVYFGQGSLMYLVGIVQRTVARKLLTLGFL